MPELDSLDTFCVVLLAAMVVVGVMGNGFIVLANGFAWIQRKIMSPSDMILTALSLSRFLYLGLILGMHCSFFLDVDKPKHPPEPLLFFWASANAATLWMAACLAAFYCVKLVDFPQTFFVKMKLHLSRLVPRLLLGSVLISFVISLPIICFEKCTYYCNKTSIVLANGNLSCPGKQPSGIIYVVGSSPSFIIVFASSVILIHSLLQHARKMQRSTGSIKDHRMDAHITAVKTLVSFVIFFSASFVAVVSLATFTDPWTMVTAIIVITAYNSGHSVILIATNPKLKQSLIRFLRSISCCSQRRTEVEPTEVGTCSSQGCATSTIFLGP